MCKASDIANFFINISLSDKKDYITNIKLNKLMYFAQGWSLARYGKPLFHNDIQAWKYGPIIPSIYHDYKNCGDSPITVVDDDYSSNVFSGEQYSLLLDVYGEYGKFTARALSNMTNESGTPWSIFYREGKNTIIPKNAIREYFLFLAPLKPFNLSLLTDELILGKYKPDLDYYVLPSDEENDDAYEI